MVCKKLNTISELQGSHKNRATHVIVCGLFLIPKTNNMIILLFSLVAALALMMLLSTAALREDFHLYKPVYQKLPEMQFYRIEDMVFAHKWNEPDNHFTWFSDSGDFQIGKNSYLPNFWMTWFSPYTVYWLFKYRAWFKKNVDIDTLPDFIEAS